MTTSERLYILQNNFSDLHIEVVQTETEWGTTHYEFVVFIQRFLLEEIGEDSSRLAEYETDGIAAMLDLSSVCISENFDEAIADCFRDANQNGGLE